MEPAAPTRHMTTFCNVVIKKKRFGVQIKLFVGTCFLSEVSLIGWSSLGAETVTGCDGLPGAHICGHICLA